MDELRPNPLPDDIWAAFTWLDESDKEAAFKAYPALLYYFGANGFELLFKLDALPLSGI